MAGRDDTPYFNLTADRARPDHVHGRKVCHRVKRAIGDLAILHDVVVVGGVPPGEIDDGDNAKPAVPIQPLILIEVPEFKGTEAVSSNLVVRMLVDGEGVGGGILP